MNALDPFKSQLAPTTTEIFSQATIPAFFCGRFSLTSIVRTFSFIVGCPPCAVLVGTPADSIKNPSQLFIETLIAAKACWLSFPTKLTCPSKKCLLSPHWNPHLNTNTLHPSRSLSCRKKNWPGLFFFPKVDVLELHGKAGLPETE